MFTLILDQLYWFSWQRVNFMRGFFHVKLFIAAWHDCLEIMIWSSCWPLYLFFYIISFKDSDTSVQWLSETCIIMWLVPHLYTGTAEPTNMKMAFSCGSWMRLLMIIMNWATVMSAGTRYFLLSISTMFDRGTFSTITWMTAQRHDKNPTSNQSNTGQR